MSKFPEISGYKFVKELGRGGMADVYLAVQENLNRMVAIKILIPAIFRDSLFLKRFRREAQTLSKLVHPNIITIYDVGKTGDSYYIVMEYLQEGMKERIKSFRKRSPDEILLVLKQVSGALFYAHREGFIHRDIKPDNIMFRKDGTPVLLDFGIARPMKASTKLTKTGMSVGTPNYISPEQAKGEKMDGRSDFYSLGVVLYEMLTGKVPYEAENTLGVILKHIEAPVPRLPARLKRYQHLIDRLMAKEVRKRLRSEDELNRLIGGLLEQGITTPKSPPKTRTKKQKVSTDTKEVTRVSMKRVGKTGGGAVSRPSPSAKPRPKKKGASPARVRKPKKRRFGRRLLLLLTMAVITVIALTVIPWPGGRGSRILDSEAVKSMVRKHNYFDSIWNKYGEYDNQFETWKKDKHVVIVDYATGLMWHSSGSSRKMKYENVSQWLINLNRRGFAGFSDWRLPTLKEAATLLTAADSAGALYIDPLFSRQQESVWTSNGYGSNGAWVVRFDDGYMQGCPFHLKHYIRPVRNID